MDKKSEIIAKVEEINAMPRITLDVMGLLNEPGTTISDITNKVKLDEALVAFILRNCNSPLYAIKSEIRSLPQALNLLGFATIKSILMSYFNKNLYSISGKSEIKNMLWVHSISVASFAQSIALLLKADPEEAYLAGLLHDIGKLIIYDSDNPSFEKVLNEIEQSKVESYKVEEKILGFNHMEIGSMIMEKWKFLQTLKEVAKFHHYNLYYDHKNIYIPIVAFANLLTYQEINKDQVDLNLFLNKYRLSEVKLEKIISKGLELQKSYLEF